MINVKGTPRRGKSMKEQVVEEDFIETDLICASENRTGMHGFVQFSAKRTLCKHYGQLNVALQLSNMQKRNFQLDFILREVWWAE